MSILSRSFKTEPGATEHKVHQAPVDIANEFKLFVSDIERLLKDSAPLTGDDLAHAKIKLNQRINQAKQSISNAGGSMLEQAKKTAVRTNEYVHEKPWAIIGAGALVSFVLGMLLGHQNEDSRE